MIPVDAEGTMSTMEWLGLGAVAAVAVYFVVMRVFYKESREADKHIDYSKIRKIKDEDN